MTMKSLVESLAVLFFMAMVGNLSLIAGDSVPKIGDIPPPLILTKTIQGPPVSDLNWEKLKGKVVVLEFWATWCGPCVASIPHLNDLADHFKDGSVVFISVTSENEDAVQLFLKSHPIKAFIGLDDYEVLNKSFHVSGIPHAVIVGTNGLIAAIAHPANIKPEHLEEVLAGKKCSLPEPAAETVKKYPDEVATNQSPALYEISIREHKMPREIRGPTCMWSVDTNGCNITGKIATVESALSYVFGKSPSCTAINCKLPDGHYDFVLRVPPQHAQQLKKNFIEALQTTFGLQVNLVTQPMDGYVLTQIATNAPGFKAVTKAGGGGQTVGGFKLSGNSMKTVVGYLELALGKPVFDESGLNELYAVDLKWKLSETEQLAASTDRKIWSAIAAHPKGDWIGSLPQEFQTGKSLENLQRLQIELAKPESQQFLPDSDAVIAAARERLGLQLTPVRRPVEVLQVSATTNNGNPD
jgi:uncharacterized protein (TIGR03435 family)